ncbi:MAG: hypothetical protein JRG73_21070, partial [Deltaproteobacteria bacterium]|nr:hypothetical protein [Deltaproteobacteria bacterium]
MKRQLTIWAGLLLVALLAGCGGGVEQAKPRRQVPGISSPTGIAEPQAKSTVEEITYQGWKALKMTNGLVTLVAVPQIGGRIMQYRLGDQSFLWVNPAEVGNIYPPVADVSELTFRDFGGYKIWRAPSDKWSQTSVSAQSILESGKWTYEIITKRGHKAEIELKSPPDADVTGLQITRNIKMYAGSTHVQITETFENVSEQTAKYSVQQTAQVPGSLAEDVSFSPEAKVYFPLNPDSKHKRRFVYLEEVGAKQFNPLDDNSLMEVSYQGRAGYIGADSMAGWVAYLDSIHSFAFVQCFRQSELEDYPLEGSTITVRTSGEEPYMAVSILTSLHQLSPGETTQATVDWYATRLSGPVRQVTDTAAMTEPVQVTKEDDKFKVTGKLGVFAPGTLAIYLKDKEGK